MKTIIVEDEPLSRIFLSNLLTEFCPGIQLLAAVPGEADAVEAITNLQPDIVFMDIELQSGTGFEVLRQINGPMPQIVFTTAFDHHALNAIRFSGIPCLQKPIDILALQTAMGHCKTGTHSAAALREAATHLLATVDNHYTPTHLSVPAATGRRFVALADVTHISAATDCCTFYLMDGTAIPVAEPLKEYESLLQEYGFYRVHQLHVINVQAIQKGSLQQDHLLLVNGVQVAVSAKKVAAIKNFC